MALACRPPPPRGADAAEPLQEPLLEGPAAGGPGPSWVQRAAAWHGPNPTVVLMAFTLLAGCALVADQRVQSVKAGAAAGSPAAAVALAETTGSEPAFGLGLPPGSEGPGGGVDRLFALGLVVVGLLACQHLWEKVLALALARAVRSLGEKGIVVEVDPRKVRARMFSGRFEVRDCTVHVPGTCRCDHGSGGDITLRLRRLAADVAVGALLRSGGGKVEVRELRVAGIDTIAGDQGARSIPKGPRKTERAEGACALDVRKVAIEGIGSKFTSKLRGAAASVQYDNFGQEKGVSALGDTLSALVMAIVEVVVKTDG